MGSPRENDGIRLRQAYQHSESQSQEMSFETAEDQQPLLLDNGGPRDRTSSEAKLAEDYYSDSGRGRLRSLLLPILTNRRNILITICICILCAAMNRMKPAKRTTAHLVIDLQEQQSMENNKPMIPLQGNDHCESPSIQAEKEKGMHIIVGGFKRNETHGFSMTSNYLSDMGLTNADIYWYRRIDLDVPEAPAIDLPCGMTLHERVMSPNRGRDGSAFYHHLLQVYDNPPEAIVFLHGHGAKYAWHTSCDAVFGRVIHYYRDLALVSQSKSDKVAKDDEQSNNNNKEKEKRVSNHMMTLTSSFMGTKYYQHKWFGQSRWKVDAMVDTPGRPQVSPPWYFPSQIFPRYYSKGTAPCRDLIRRWKDVIPKHSRSNPYMSASCCASFVLPGDRVRRYPRELYQELFDVLTDEKNDDYEIGKQCFEYLVFDLFHDDGLFEFQDVLKFYDEADALVHGKKRYSERTEPDESVVKRLQNCAAS